MGAEGCHLVSRWSHPGKDGGTNSVFSIKGGCFFLVWNFLSPCPSERVWGQGCQISEDTACSLLLAGGCTTSRGCGCQDQSRGHKGQSPDSCPPEEAVRGRNVPTNGVFPWGPPDITVGRVGRCEGFWGMFPDVPPVICEALIGLTRSPETVAWGGSLGGPGDVVHGEPRPKWLTSGWGELSCRAPEGSRGPFSEQASGSPCAQLEASRSRSEAPTCPPWASPPGK